MVRIKGETVYVSLRTWGEPDALGNRSEQYGEPKRIDNILVGNGSNETLVEDGQRFAYSSTISFCFPKGYAEDLRGALITRNGVTYKVIGNPQPITEANIPPLIGWNIKAMAVIYDG